MVQADQVVDRVLDGRDILVEGRDIAAGHEAAPRAPEDNGPDGVVRCQILDRGVEINGHITVERVQHVGAVECEGGDGTLLVH